MIWLASHLSHVMTAAGGMLVTLLTQRAIRLLVRYRVVDNGHVRERSIGLTVGSGRAEDSPTPRERPRS